MCLSDVYMLKRHQEKELICKNVASVRNEEGKLVFTNILGVTTTLEAQIDCVDLMDNFIYVRGRESE